MRFKLLPPAAAGVLLSLAGCSGQHLVNVLTPTAGYVKHAGIAYGDLPRQKLDVYVPKKLAPGAPVVVFFYGGRWEEGSRQGYKFAAQALTSRGFIAILPDYRLYPQVKFPAFVQDGARAVKWAHDHAAQYGGDVKHLFVMGHSAGAYIAAMLALDGHYLQAVGGSRKWLSGMIGLAGPYDFLPLEADDLKDMFGPPSQYPRTQPINYVDGKEPPLLLLQGLEDHTVYPKNTRNLAAKVRAKGGKVEAIYYRRKTHISLVAALAAPLRYTGTVLSDIADFVNRQSGNPAPTAVADEKGQPRRRPLPESHPVQPPESRP